MSFAIIETGGKQYKVSASKILEIEKLNISISKDTLLKQIKTNKNFLDENGNFQRIKYEKFLLENNQSAAGFELRLKKREEQKNLFDYIGAGTISPKFLSKKLFIEENKKLAAKIKENEITALKLQGALETLEYLAQDEETMSHPPDEVDEVDAE